MNSIIMGQKNIKKRHFITVNYGQLKYLINKQPLQRILIVGII